MTHYIQDNKGNKISVAKAGDSELIVILRSTMRVLLLPGMYSYCATQEDLDSRLPKIIESFDKRGMLEFWADVISTEIRNRGIEESTISLVNN